MSKSTARRRLIRLILVLLLLGLPLALVSSYWRMIAPGIAELAGTNPSTTALMDARAAEARQQGRSDRREWTWVPLSFISPHLQRAVIMAEDAGFYYHQGFDWEGIREATTRNLWSWKLGRGGSTITQQLAKNLYLSSDKTLSRKAREALITLELERQLPKKRILELYLNVAEWGQGVYGAEAAARHHFGKSALVLSPEEAALLAAILPSPRSFDPLRMTRYLSVRQKQILRWMQRGRGMAVTPSLEPPAEAPVGPPEGLTDESAEVPPDEPADERLDGPAEEPSNEPAPEPPPEPPAEQPEKGDAERDGAR